MNLIEIDNKTKKDESCDQSIIQNETIREKKKRDKFILITK